MNQVPTKIVLKSTTRMSLNDRFSHIAPSAQVVRANVAAEHQVSAANRRLAQQLANRPGISQNQAATMYNRQPGRGRRGTMQQRLGQGNVKARLSLPVPQAQVRGRGRGRGNMMQSQTRGAINQWSPNKNRGRGGFAMRATRGQVNMRGQGRGQFNRSWSENGQMGVRGQGPPRSRGLQRGRNPRGFHQVDRLTGQSNNTRGRGGRGAARGGQGQVFRGRGGFRGGRGGRGRGGKPQPQANVNDLDTQLDAYMSKTKSSLDHELDSYMSKI